MGVVPLPYIDCPVRKAVGSQVVHHTPSAGMRVGSTPNRMARGAMAQLADVDPLSLNGRHQKTM